MLSLNGVRYWGNKILSILMLLASLGFFSTTAHALSWEDLWLTPHQQANQDLQNENYQALTESQNKDWQGVGHYQLGDHAAAAERFAEGEGLDSRYNQGTALTQAGEYDKAIELFDSVLDEKPTHEKALKNRNIARQLKELQQQQEQQNQDQQQGDSDQNQENQDQENSEQDQENSSDDSQNQNSESSQDEQDAQSQENQQSEEEKSTEEQQQQAESQEENEDAQEEETARQQAQQETEMPLSEDQQATEQWLRKIPDDPAGLLRRKLRRNHAAEYPNVVNGESPW